MSESNKQISARFTELFSTGDEQLADAILHPDVVFRGATPQELRGRDAAKGFIAAYRAAFPDAHSTVVEQVAEGDTVATRWRSRGTHQGELGDLAPTGRAIDVEGVTIEKFAEGRIVEVWVVRDELGLMRQLGALPEPAATA